jgi:hypothetical protein
MVAVVFPAIAVVFPVVTSSAMESGIAVVFPAITVVFPVVSHIFPAVSTAIMGKSLRS